MAAEELRGHLPNEVMNDAQAAAIGPATEGEIDLLQLLIGSVSHRVADGQDVGLDEKELRSVVGWILFHVRRRQPLTAEQFGQGGHQPLRAFLAIRNENAVFICEANVAASVSLEGHGQVSDIQAGCPDGFTERGEKLGERRGSILGWLQVRLGGWGRRFAVRAGCFSPEHGTKLYEEVPKCRVWSFAYRCMLTEANEENEEANCSGHWRLYLGGRDNTRLAPQIGRAHVELQ